MIDTLYLLKQMQNIAKYQAYGIIRGLEIKDNTSESIVEPRTFFFFAPTRGRLDLW